MQDDGAMAPVEPTQAPVADQPQAEGSRPQSASEAPTTTNTQPTEAGEGPDATKLAKDNARLVGVIKSLQTQIETLRSATAQPEAASAAPKDDTHPALKGLKTSIDDNGETLYDLDGIWAPKEFVINQYGVQQQLQAMRDHAAALAQAQQQQTVAELQRELNSAIVDARSKIGDFGQQNAEVEKMMFAQVERTLTQAMNTGQPLTADLVGGALSSVVSLVRAVYAAGSTMQSADNAEYRSMQPLAGDAMNGVPAPKPLNEMTVPERRAYANRIARNVAMRRGD